jgi:hypothetical protein
VLKLNESLFKPLFLKYVDWATSEASENTILAENRSILLYRSLDVLLEHLKSIFAPYCSYTMDNAVEWLQQYAAGRMHDQRWDLMISAFAKMMLYDNDGFLNESLLSGLISPLVNQLNLKTEDKVLYSQCMESSLVPCLGQLAIAIHRTEPSLLKQLNHQVLMKTREEQTAVRLAALKTMKEFYERMGEEFLVHLPETVPFLAELLEDDDEHVETLCREVIKVVEEHLGESLQEHLK